MFDDLKQLSKKELMTLVNSGHLGYSTPATLSNGVYIIKSLKKLDEITINYKGDVDEEVEEPYEDNDEIFTYWDLKHNKPLFDIIGQFEYGKGTSYYLSDNSIFGMYWLIGNKMHTGMENAIRFHKLDVPTNVDLQKYTENNFKIAIMKGDFKK